MISMFKRNANCIALLTVIITFSACEVEPSEDDTSQTATQSNSTDQSTQSNQETDTSTNQETSMQLDSDFDGIIDSIDQDDDNDGFLDTDEIATGHDPLDDNDIINFEDGLFVKYEFEGNLTDSSMNMNHGSAMGSISYIDAVNGDGVNLDSDIEYVISPPITAQNLTVVMNVRFDSLSTNSDGSIYSLNDSDQSISLKVNSLGDVWGELEIGTNKITTSEKTFNVNDNQFHHIVLVINNDLGAFSLYVDLLEWVTVEFTSGSIELVGANQYIGSNESFSNGHFNGVVDNFNVYQRVLVNQEIQNNFITKPVSESKLNDTGITTCSNETSNYLECPVEGFEGQDGEYGRDSQNNLSKKGGGNAGFDFSKIDSEGNVLPEGALIWSCVLDNHTSLMWEVKTNDGGLHDMLNLYTWYNSDPTQNAGAEGRLASPQSKICVGSRCDSEGFVDAVNSEGLCGYNDWLVPSYDQLVSLMDFSVSLPSIDQNYFPNNSIAVFWSANTSAYDTRQAWFVNINYGGFTIVEKDYELNLKLVRKNNNSF